MTPDIFKAVDPHFKLTRGKWTLVYQNLQVPELFERTDVRVILWPKKIKELQAEGYRIISATLHE